MFKLGLNLSIEGKSVLEQVNLKFDLKRLTILIWFIS